MERKIKGIALMIFGIFLFLISICVTYFFEQSYAFITGLFISFCFEAIGFHFVFSEQNNDTDKAVDNFVKGEDE